MEAYAVVETGGKQYRVATGMKFDVERLQAEPGQDVETAAVLQALQLAEAVNTRLPDWAKRGWRWEIPHRGVNISLPPPIEECIDLLTEAIRGS